MTCYSALPPVCANCGTRLTTRAYIARLGVHVACPAPEQIAHCKRMGRPL